MTPRRWLVIVGRTSFRSSLFSPSTSISIWKLPNSIIIVHYPSRKINRHPSGHWRGQLKGRRQTNWNEANLIWMEMFCDGLYRMRRRQLPALSFHLTNNKQFQGKEFETMTSNYCEITGQIVLPWLWVEALGYFLFSSCYQLFLWLRSLKSFSLHMDVNKVGLTTLIDSHKERSQQMARKKKNTMKVISCL